MRAAATAVLGFMLLGCAAHLETRPFDLAAWRPDSAKSPVEGVVYYAPQYVKIRYAFTTQIDKDGKVTGSADSATCRPVIQKEEIQIMPNYQRAYVVRQTTGFLSGNKLAVTLSNGLLTGVNAESASKVPELLTSVASLVKEVGVLAFPSQPGGACNAGPRIVGFAPIELGPPAPR
jgi:hypothetical protein